MQLNVLCVKIKSVTHIVSENKALVIIFAIEK